MNKVNFSALKELFLSRSLHRQKQQILNISSIPTTQTQIAALKRKDEGVLNTFLSECFDYTDGDFDKLESISSYRSRLPCSFLENQFYIEKKKEVIWNCQLKKMKENEKKRNQISLRNMKLKLGRKEGKTANLSENENVRIINKIKSLEKSETVWRLENMGEKERKENGEWTEIEEMTSKLNYEMYEDLNKKEGKISEVHENQNEN